MRENKEKLRRESDAAFALAAFLLNFLIVLVVCAGVWTLQSLAAESDSLGLFLRDYTIYR